MATPHDSLFRAVFGDLDNARSLLRANLPAVLALAVDWPTLQRVPAEFCDADLRQRDADLLFAVRFRGRVLLLHVLVEHKSGVDRWTVLQASGYVLRALARWRELLRWAMAEPAGQHWLSLPTWYVDWVTEVRAGVMRKELEHSIGPVAEEIVMSTFERISKEAEARGQAQGVVMGAVQGERAVLLRLLTRRFGPLPAAVEARIHAAGTGQLELWADRVLDAATLDEVLGG